MFDAQLSALKDRYRVVSWDMPGHGCSAPLRGSLGFPRMAVHVMGILMRLEWTEPPWSGIPWAAG